MDIWKRLELQDKMIADIQLTLSKTNGNSSSDSTLKQKVESLEKKVAELSFRVLRREVPSMAFKQLMERHVRKVLKSEGFQLTDDEDPVTKASGIAYRDELLRSIINAVEKRWHAGIINQSRKVSTALARHVACYLMREMTQLSYPEIGIVLDRDHSTVMHAHSKVKERVLAQPEFGQTILEIRQQIEDHMKAEQLKIAGENSGKSSKVDMLATRT